MLTWIKSLLGYTDRATAAASRVAVAWEEVATMSEAVRDEMRLRLGGGESRVLPAAVTGEEEATGSKRRK